MRRRVGALVALPLAIVATAATLVGFDDGAEPVASAATAPPATEPTTTTTTAPEPVLVEPPPLPVPDAPPADPYADVPVIRVGAIAIPKIALDHAVYEGVTLTVLDNGPGHWPGSAMPGQRGNSVFPGHRVTHSHPFRRLDELVPGDEITFSMADGTYTYAVTGTQIVSPKDLWVTDPTETATVTLIACHPPGSARERIVVKGDLVRTAPSLAVLEIAAAQPTVLS